MDYYKRLVILALPMFFQHTITISLNLIDNVMVGRLGAFALAAVGSANQIYSIYEMILFGLFSGAAVLVSQYFGAKDYPKVKQIVGMDIAIGISVALVTVGLIQCFAPQILSFFSAEKEVILLGTSYIRIISLTYLIMGVSFAISYNCRALQTMKYPAIISCCSLLTNTLLNYMLIYGNFGCPALGVEGAALATLAARTIELTALILYLCLDRKHPLHGPLREFGGFSWELIQPVLKTATPVLISEGGWAIGVALVFAAYGKIGAEALAVMQAVNTVCGLCQCAMFSLGNASAALTGEALGQHRADTAYENGKKFLKVQCGVNLCITIVILLLRKPVIFMYDFEGITAELLMTAMAAFAFTQIPRMMAYSVQCGILRAGGDTFFCMVVELLCNLVIEVTLAYFSVLILGLPLYLCLFVASIGNIIKAVVQFRRFISKKWINIMV